MPDDDREARIQKWAEEYRRLQDHSGHSRRPQSMFQFQPVLFPDLARLTGIQFNEVDPTGEKREAYQRVYGRGPESVMELPGAAAPPEKQELARLRTAWLQKPHFGQILSFGDIENRNGPSFKTIQRYANGDTTSRTPYVRGRLAHALKCAVSEVPE